MTNANRFLILIIVIVFYNLKTVSVWISTIYLLNDVTSRVKKRTISIILTAVGKEAKDAQFGTGSVEPVLAPEESSYEATYKR